MGSIGTTCSMCGPTTAARASKPDPVELVTTFSIDRYGPSARQHPCTLDLINLVNLEYSLHYGDACIHSCMQRDESLNKIVEYLAGQNWKLLQIMEVHPEEPKHHGAAFYNRATHHLVIVHRGTKPTSNLQSLAADVEEIWMQVNGPFTAAAYLFTKEIVDRYGNGAESITVTGHSLGGWLSQCATFYMKYLEYLEGLKATIRKSCHGNPICDKLELIKAKHCKSRHLHCVSFDGPGCKEVFEKLFPERYPDDGASKFRSLDALDITVFLTLQNFANVTNEQVGSVFQMDCESIFSPLIVSGRSLTGIGGKIQKVWRELTKAEWLDRFFGSHACERILKFWHAYYDQCKGKVVPTDASEIARVLKVTNWNVAERAWLNMAPSEKFEFNERNLLEFRMSCFDNKVRESIRQLMMCKEHYSDHQVWQDYSKHPSIKFLTTGFECLHDFQVMELEKAKEKVLNRFEVELYRDFFIRNIQFASQEFAKLGINPIFPNYLEARYISATDQYVKKLPKFAHSGPGYELLSMEAFVREKFANLKDSRFVMSIQTPAASTTRIFTAKICDILKSLKQRAEGSLYLQDPKKYFVINADYLSSLHDLLGNETKPFLANLNHVIIECETEHQIELVKKWIDKLWSRREIETKIVIVHGPGISSTDSRISANYSYIVQPGEVDSLVASLDTSGLIKGHTIQFKLKGYQIHLTDLVPEVDQQFYDSLRELGGHKIYSAFQRGKLGRPLPALGEFEQSYFTERQFQDIEILKYSEGEILCVLCATNPKETEFVEAFARKRHSNSNVEAILCKNWNEFDAKLHRIVQITEASEFSAHGDKLKSCSGHIVQVQFDDDAREYKLVWIESFGSPNMSKLKVRGFGKRKCPELLESEKRLTIITDEPGMGKTTIMKQLAHISQNTDMCGSWTIFVELGKVLTILTKLETGMLDLKRVVEALAEMETEAENEVCPVSAKVIGHLLNHKSKVRIFFDGLDEINEEQKSVVLSIVDILLEESKSQIFIATRKRLKSELENRFSTLCYNLCPFTYEQGIGFLEKYWTNNSSFKDKFGFLTAENREHVREYIKLFLAAFKKAIGHEAAKFVGIPFQLRMLGDAHLQDYFLKFYEARTEAGCIRKHLPNFTNITDLYKLFIETKIKEGLEAKYGLHRSTSPGKWLFEELLQMHRVAGFSHIFSAKVRTEAIGPYKAMRKEGVDTMYACGIITEYRPRPEEQSDQCDETDFVHRTIAEFGAAELIFLNLKPNLEEQRERKAMNHFLNSYIFLSKYENVLNFLDMMITTDESTPELLKNAAKQGMTWEGLRQHMGQINKVEVDRLGRNVLHYIVRSPGFNWDRKCMSCGKRANNLFLLEYESLLGSKDLFDATPLAYVHSLSNSLANLIRGISNRAIYLANILMNVDLEREMKMKLNMEDKKRALLLDIMNGRVHKVLQMYLNDNDQTLCLPPCKEAFHDCQIFENNRIVDFVARNELYLSDYSIEVRKNELGSRIILLSFADLGCFDLEFALGLGCESRINFVCRLLEDDSEGPNRDKFETDLFEFMQKNNFENYEKAIAPLRVGYEESLLELFLKKSKNLDAMQNSLYEIWTKLNFSSLLRALKHDGHSYGFFEAFYKLLPAKQCKDQGRLLSEIEEALAKLPVTAREYWRTRSAKFVSIFPIVWRLLDKDTRREFVNKNAELIKYTLNTDPIPAQMDYPDLISPYLECLQNTEGGPNLLDQFLKNERALNILKKIRVREKKFRGILPRIRELFITLQPET